MEAGGGQDGEEWSEAVSSAKSLPETEQSWAEQAGPRLPSVATVLEGEAGLA